jgi:gas vesicle protein
MPSLNAIRTLTVRGQSQGLDKVAGDLNKVSDAQNRVGQTGEAMALTTDRTAKRVLSVAGSYDRLIEKNDRMVWIQRQLDREMQIVNRAFDVGHINAGQMAQTTELLQGKFQRLAAAETAARTQINATSQAVDQQAVAMNRLAAANDNAAGSTGNIAAQFQDIGVTAAMGMNPLMIALQQGTQLSSVLNTMQNPLRGLASAFVSIINPVSLLTIGFVAASAAAIQFFTSSADEAEEAASALEEHDKWLDTILQGYDSVREAAQRAGDEARKLPQAEVNLALSGDVVEKQEAYAEALAAVRQQILATNTTQETLMSLMLEGGQAALAQRDALLEIQSAAQAANPDLDGLALSLKAFIQNNPDSVLRNIADAMLANVEAARAAEAALSEAGTAASNLGLELQDFGTIRSGIQEWIDESRALEASLRAAAAAMQASLNAALQAAQGYGTAAGAANVYAGSLQRLQALIPAVAAAQQAQNSLAAATIEYDKGKKALDGLTLSRDAYLAREAELTSAFEAAKNQVTGLTDATAQLEQAERQAAIGGMADREAAAARISDRYAELQAQLTAAGASEDELARATAAMNQELAASGASFDQVAAKSGGAAKALKDAERDFNSFISTADKLAEKLFPAEYARKEAAELMSLLDQYRDKLDSFQIQGVEKEIANLTSAADMGLRNLEDRAEETSDVLMDTLGSALGSLFDGPMEDMDEFFDKLISGFAQMGQANLGKLFESFGAPNAANDNAGGSTKIFDAIFQGSKKGTEAGAQDGLMGLLKGGGGLSGMAGAGLGGFGIGAQTQNPIMGALGGALSGAAMGPIGAVIGGIAGFVGGLFGANKALKEAREKLNQVRPAIEQFIDSMNGEVVSGYAKALADANRQAQEYIGLAKKAKDYNLVREIEAALANLPATLARQYEKDLQASVNALQGNSYLNEVAAAQELYNTRLKDAEQLGADGSLALTELNLTLQKIADEANLSEAELARLAAIFPDIASGLTGALGTAGLDKAVADAQEAVDRARGNLRAAYDAEVSALNQVIERNKQFIRSLEAFKQSLRFDQGISPLSPIDRLKASERDFMETRQKALAGDQDAIGELENVSRQYLEEARAYYGTSEGYMRIWEQVDATLDQALARATKQVTETEKQLGVLNAQVGHLIDINNSVLSVADAVRALELANKQLGTAQQDRTSALVDRLYENVLGRDADAGGAAWWAKEIQKAGGLTAEIYKRFADGARGKGEVVMPGYAQGGFTGGMEGQIAGYVHGQEYVANAMATRMFRPQLEAMNRGVAPSNDNGAMAREIRALRADLAVLTQTVAAGAQATVSAVGNVSTAARKSGRDTDLARLQRKASNG